ncbi:MAG: hypothetical protein H6Q51_2350, partial [Deltaproteobacteria bacterium]|nr:hypothetical protein [Deltaproteobacteria bacterium]MBP1727052.1 hypothetical protein [Deltaproteobacteria bacterium]
EEYREHQGELILAWPIDYHIELPAVN